MKSNLKSGLKKIIFEMIPVILGILIALLINNWQQSRQDQNFVDSTLKVISEELKENKSYLEEFIPKHEALADTIELYTNSDVKIGAILAKTKGMQMTSIKNTAWKAFINQNLELIDFRLVSTLTDIEETKIAMNRTAEKLIDFIYANAASNDSYKKEIFNMIIQDFTIMEEDMLDYHDDALKQIE